MKEEDHEHNAFIRFAVENGLDLNMHPLHLLYLNTNTCEFLKAFQAGYEAGKECADQEDDGMCCKGPWEDPIGGACNPEHYKKCSKCGNVVLR